MNCKVCQNSKASSHSYYGATGICPSCRGFFMRSVQSEIYSKFQKCPSTYECVIDSKSRKSCKSCRFQKCLSAGMKITYVITSREKFQTLVSNNTKLTKPLKLMFQEVNKEEALDLWNKFLFLGSLGVYESYVTNIQHVFRHLDLQNFYSGYDNLENEKFDDYIDFELIRRFVVEFFKINGQGSLDAYKLFKHNFYRMKTFYYAAYCFGVSIFRASYLNISSTKFIHFYLSE